MKRALIACVASLLALGLIVPAAQAATKVLHVRVPITRTGTTPPTPTGTLTLDFVFKNTRGDKKRFTPRQLTRIDFSRVPLYCANGHTSSPGSSQLLYSATFETHIKFEKIPLAYPKPGRYAFRFLPYSFPTFTGTIRGTIEKTNSGPRPRPLRSQGKLDVQDLDADPGHSDCSTLGPQGWGGLPLTPA
jgi:hypothetical protein